MAEQAPYLDKVGSVSGLRRDETFMLELDDEEIDEQDRRFHNGW